MATVGIPIVAIGTAQGGLITRSSSKRKKKYHSGRGVYVVVVGSTFGPCSAPSRTDSPTITSATISIIVVSFRTAYGKNGLPFFFRASYPRRYSSFSRLFNP